MITKLDKLMLPLEYFSGILYQASAIKHVITGTVYLFVAEALMSVHVTNLPNTLHRSKVCLQEI